MLTHTQTCQGITYLFLARDINISQRSEVVGADIGRGLIQGVMWKIELLYLLHSYYFVLSLRRHFFYVLLYSRRKYA